jgi:hypothetical protein
MRLAKAARALAPIALVALITACGGGGSGTSSFAPAPVSTSGSPTSSQSGGKVTIPASVFASRTSNGRKYIPYETGQSALVIQVLPSDPAEQSQWLQQYGASSLSVCYNLTPTASSGLTVTGTPATGLTVTGIQYPSPPGFDTFNLYVYAGNCVNAFTPPAPPSGGTSASLVLAESPSLNVNITAGQAYTLNEYVYACTAAGALPTLPNCPNPPVVPNPGTPINLSAPIQNVYLAAATPAPSPLAAAVPTAQPIVGPIREQGAFAGKVGFPVALTALDANGNPVGWQGPTTGVTSGFFPNGPTSPNCAPYDTYTATPTKQCADNIQISHTEPGGGTHYELYLVDATTGAILANDSGGAITVTQMNALDNFDVGHYGAGTAGQPWVIVATFDGKAQTPGSAETTATVTLTGTLNSNASTPTKISQSIVITPQSTLFSAQNAGTPGSGYLDAAAPYTAPADILNLTGSTLAAPNNGYWVTDGSNIHLVGTASYAVAGASKLSGETLFNPTAVAPNGQILAVDNNTTATPSGGPLNTGSGALIPSGIFVFDPVAHTSKPLAVQYGFNNYIAFGAPQGIGFTGQLPDYAYVFAGNNIYVVDLTGGGTHGLQADGTNTYYLADLIGYLPVTGLNGGSGLGFDVAASGTKLTFADPGNNRIAQIDTGAASCGVTQATTNPATCTPTTIVSGHPFVGFSSGGPGSAAAVASDSKGQLYTISSLSGSGTATPLLGSSETGGTTVADGVEGTINYSGTSPSPGAFPYVTQGVAQNFFSTAAYTPSIPFSLTPFAAAGPVFGVDPALTLNQDTSSAVATFGTTAGNTVSAFGVQFISAAGANTALTADSFLFADKTALRTLVP